MKKIILPAFAMILFSSSFRPAGSGLTGPDHAAVAPTAAPAPAFYRCASSGIYLVSNDSFTTSNGIHILEFYGQSRDLIPELGSKYAMYMQSGSQKIPVRVKEVLTGEFMISQVILQPVSALNMDQEYVLHIDGLGNSLYGANQFDRTLGNYQPLRFRVQATLAVEPSAFGTAPVYESGSYEMFGCGPARNASFTQADTQDGQFIRAAVRSVRTGKQTEYLLRVQDGQLNIGHGMCSGAFLLNEPGEYELQVASVDAAGKTSGFGPVAKFKAPMNQAVRE